MDINWILINVLLIVLQANTICQLQILVNIANGLAYHALVLLQHAL